MSQSKPSSPEMEFCRGRPKRNAAKAVTPSVTKASPPSKQKPGTPIRPKSATPGKTKTLTPVSKTKSKSVSGSPVVSPNRYISLANLTEENDEISDKTPDSASVQCAKCKKSTNKNGKLLECNRCKDHYCISCLGKSAEEHKVLSSSDFMWFCCCCREKVERNLAVDRDIETKCKEIMSKFETRVASLETALTDKCSKAEAQQMVEGKCSKAEAQQMVEGKCSKVEAKQMIDDELNNRLATAINEALEKKLGPVNAAAAGATVDERPNETHGSEVLTRPKETHVSEVLTEINERKSRENNIVIYGLEEIESKSYVARQEADHAKIQTVMAACEVELPKADIDRVVRLGKYRKDQKKRPLLVAMKTDSKKADIFNGTKKLKDNEALKEVRIANDQTIAEREYDKKLYAEAQELEKKNSGEFQYKVRGPPWARRIVRIRVKTPEEEKD